MTKFDDAECLKYWPFEEDFGAPDDKVLKDKIGVARKTGPCHICTHDIQPGERVRMLSAVFDGQLMSYRWCSTCCAAMAAIWQGDFDRLDAQFAQRYESSNVGDERAPTAGTK